MTDLKKETSDKYNAVETLGLNESKVTKNDLDKLDSPKISDLVKDNDPPEEDNTSPDTKQSCEQDNQEEKEKVGKNDESKSEVHDNSNINQTERTGQELNTKNTDVPSLPLKNILSKIQLDQDGNKEHNIKINPGSANRSIDKRKIRYDKFQDEPSYSNNSSSLPPSDIGDVVVNISAIEIDKNELSIYISPREENEKKRILQEEQALLRKKIAFVVIYFLLFLCVVAVLIYVLSTP